MIKQKFTVKQIVAREILDSRGLPTVETKLILASGVEAKAGIPSGASTGQDEALELRDGDKNRYRGKGVLKAINNVNKILAKKIIGLDARKQKEIDQLMIANDGTNNKSKLGANAILSVSLALCRATAFAKNIPLYQYIREYYQVNEKKYRLPVPALNFFNGGKHGDTNLDIQEIMIIPQRGKSFADKIRISSEIFYSLKDQLKLNGLSSNVGDEGGFSTNIQSTKQILDLFVLAIEKAGYLPGKEVSLGLDVGASGLYDEKKKKYVFGGEKKEYTSGELVDFYQNLQEKYPLISIEDGLAEEDWDGWQLLTDRLGKSTVLIGDDLFVTNSLRLQKGIDLKVANAVLIKVNQIGTLTETINTINLARKNKYKVMVSHRSGETNDDFIADLAVAINSDFSKMGSIQRGERVAKYNRLMEIEQEIKGKY